MQDNVKVFERNVEEYERWFEEKKAIYESELLLIKRLLPKTGVGLEIGVGTGRFSSMLDIKIGIDPAFNMLLKAKERNIEVVCARAEALPFKEESFDFAIMITVLCFLKDPLLALKEAKRIIKRNGALIIGMINKESRLGKLYELKKKKSKFYSHAKFLSVKQVIGWLKEIGFKPTRIYQTIFNETSPILFPESPIKGYTKGGFVGILALLI